MILLNTHNITLERISGGYYVDGRYASKTEDVGINCSVQPISGDDLTESGYTDDLTRLKLWSQSEFLVNDLFVFKAKKFKIIGVRDYTGYPSVICNYEARAVEVKI